MHETATVTGLANDGARWALNKFAERVDCVLEKAGDDDVSFSVQMLPPVEERVALMSLVAGPGLLLDDAKYDSARAELARRLWDHHGLDEVYLGICVIPLFESWVERRTPVGTRPEPTPKPERPSRSGHNRGE